MRCPGGSGNVGRWRALITQPALLLLDEASTHDPRLVERPEVSRVVELREGRMVS